MLLKSLSVDNYRCYSRLNALPLERITAFIGPNDSGKSSMLSLLRHCFRNEPIPLADFRNSNEPIVTELYFDISRAHEAEKAQPFMLSERELRVKKIFEPGSKPKTLVFQQCFVDQRFNNLAASQVKALDDLLAILGVDPKPRPKTKDERLVLIQEYLRNHPQPQHNDWVLAGDDLTDVLPEFLIFGADEDLSLQSGPLVATLRQVYRHFLQNEQPSEVSTLLEKSKVRLREAIAQINPVVCHFAGNGMELVVEPTIDLANGLNLGDVFVRTAADADEPRAFSRCGDGTKRRIMLGLFHWSNAVLSKIAEEQQRSLLWCFDEPDTHLHYQAQYELLGIIKELAAEQMQVLICTHSIPIIDRLSPKSVRQMLPDRTSRCTMVEYLGSQEFDEEDEDIERFLQAVGSGMGFANSLLFYERCFLLVEGPTEEKALPILYRALYNEDMIEKGIRIFCAESDRAAITLARVLHRHRKEVVLLLDSDAKEANNGALDNLARLGFNKDERVLFVGRREFEDAFSNDALLLCMQQDFARCDGQPWTEKDIEQLRSDSKFSNSLLASIRKASQKNISKPEFGRKLAERLTGSQLIPSDVREVFDRLRHIVERTQLEDDNHDVHQDDEPAESSSKRTNDDGLISARG